MPNSFDHAGTWALAQVSAEGGPTVPALVAHDRALDLSDRPELGSPRSTADILARWDELEPVLAALAADTAAAWQPLSGFHVHSPVEPRQIFQCAANYRTHVIDLVAAHHDGSDGRSVEEVRAEAAAHMDERLAFPPFVFTGLPSAICGPYDDVVLPADGEQPDWELELAAVIGRPTRRVSAEDALECVAGWVIVNDLTLRERVIRRDAGALGMDWLASKNAPTFLPTGPLLVPRSAVPDPSDLRITLRLNGDVMQDESTKDLIFDTAAIIAHCSKVATLLPGDLVLTGSPAGNGLAHGRLLRAGDRMDCSITGLGAQSNVCVEEAC
ncbi:fumarylacetoacetate hydrolase family protein [Streptomyces mangrovisoli]|uniref:Hydrolase n=1 Tax=Streptomyces mangrovisoli TaxID=1428628 RepID=A0A1J4NTQ3_9ACTN|nr:fumarylacetoacetate hydrolase family protein [Streptomyces mangrovisoli]OIJ65490.1 hydrolase [Streptomyces mangrovisoli]